MSHTSRDRAGVRIVAPSSAGFTLLELLVGVGLGALLLAALYASFFTVMRATGAVEDTLGARMEAGRLLDRLSSEVRSASFAPADRLTVFSGAQSGMNSELVFTAYVDSGVSASAGGADLLTIRYAAERTAGGLSLVREAWSPFIGEKNSFAAIEEIEGFEVSFYNGTGWAKAWDSALEGRMPVAVRARVVLPGGEKIEMLARTMAR